MSAGGVATVVLLLGGLWPFGGGADRADPEPIIATLDADAARLREETTGGATPLAADALRAIRHYREFLALDEAPAALRVQALRRLADLELETGLALQADMGDEDRARSHLSSSLAGYDELLEHWPNHDDPDRVLYQRARVEEALGRSADALAGLERLVDTYPDSVHAAEAQFRRAERLFVEGRYDEAEAAYTTVLHRHAESTFHEQALYKAGWSHYRLADYTPGIAAFMALLDRRFERHAADDLTLLPRTEQELLEDTLRVLGLSFSYLEGPDSIDQMLEDSPGRAWSHLLYAALGQLYLGQERYRDAARAFEAYVHREPLKLLAPAFQQAAIEAYAEGRFPSLVLEGKQRYVARYGLDSEFWAVRDSGEHPAVQTQLRGHLIELAAHDHAEAQTSRAADDQARAVGWYRSLLAWFPLDEAAGSHSFLLAELLFESARYVEATAAYVAAAYDYGSHERDAEAGYAALLAAARYAAHLDGDVSKAWREQTAANSLRFAEVFPEHPHAVPVLTALAERHFGEGDFVAAIEVAERVVDHQPAASADAARVAWTVIAHAQFDRGRYELAETAYLRLQEMALPEQQAEITRRIVASMFRQGEAAREIDDVDGAVGHFVRLGRVVPAAPEAAHALYDAGALLLGVERWNEAAAILEDFRALHPEHALVLDASRLLATALREDARPVAAAEEFERIAAARTLDPEVRRAALWEAADLFMAAARPADALRVYRQIVERYPIPVDDALEARHQLALLAGDAGDAGERRRWLEETVRVDADMADARTDRSRYLAAHASLELAEPVRDAFMAVRLTMPLESSLRTKRRLMDEALDAYTAAADYGVIAVVTAATWQIGELYYQLSRDLLESERPTGLEPDALEQYEILLEEQTFPIEEQALDLFLANAERAADGLFDQWIEASFARLAVISPGRYARTERRDHAAIALHR